LDEALLPICSPSVTAAFGSSSFMALTVSERPLPPLVQNGATVLPEKS